MDTESVIAAAKEFGFTIVLENGVPKLRGTCTRTESQKQVFLRVLARHREKIVAWLQDVEWLREAMGEQPPEPEPPRVSPESARLAKVTEEDMAVFDEANWFDGKGYQQYREWAEGWNEQERLAWLEYLKTHPNGHEK